MSLTTPKKFAILAGLGALTLTAMTACSPPDTGSASAGGEKITIAETTAPSTLDPQGSGLFADRFAWQLSYECLMNTTPEGTVEPALAESYEMSEDGRSYTFTLRDGVTFSSGDPLEADDVVYSFERLLDGTEQIGVEVFPTLTDVEKVSDNEVKFNLKSPDAGFLSNQGNPLVWGCAIMSKEADSENLATTMVGTGPWVQTDYQPNTSLSLERNDGYWGEKTASPNLDVLYMPTMGTQVSNLKAGKVDLVFPDQASAKGLEDSGLTVSTVHTDSTIFLQINNTKAPFDDPKVREALALTLDRQSLADQAYGGAAQPSGYLPPSLQWAPEVGDIPNYTQDLDKAKKLLAEAGHPDGLKTSLLYISDYDAGTNDLMAAMQDQMAQAGFEVELKPMEAAVWSDSRTVEGGYELSWNAQSYYANPYQYVAPAPGRQGPVPDELQDLLDKAMHADSEDAYHKALAEVEMKEAETVYPTLTLLATDMFVAHDEALTGVEVPSSQSRTFLTKVKK